MKLPRVLFTSVFLFATVVPVSPSSAATITTRPTVAPDRETSTTANRSSIRSAPLVIPAETTTTTAAPVVTTPPTTAAPVTTTTAAPRVTTPPTTAAPAPAPVAAAEVAATEAAPAPVGGAGKDAVVSIARAQVGKAYRSGATGPNAFDCSGLVYYVFNQAGIEMPRLTDVGYYARSTHITRAELQPGDIIKGSGHIGIYVGDGMMVHASTPRGGVKLAPIDAPGKPLGYGRLG